MTDIPPWRALKTMSSKSSAQEAMVETGNWIPPDLIFLDKHLRFYKDLLRSTERVELTLSHSGKTEVFETLDDPSDPSRSSRIGPLRQEVIFIPVRTENDPRISMMKSDGSVGARPEYEDEMYLRDLLNTRSRLNTPAGSRNPSPTGSPKQSGNSTPVNGFGLMMKPPPPPLGGSGKPPPPPKAPPPEKKIRISIG